jgi:RHS repeat-associated protein
VVQRFAYDAYGQPEVLSANWQPATDNYAWDIRYAGYRYDSLSGLYHVRHRYYHPRLGRWVSRDPLGYVDGMSLYQYVRSGPLSMLDMLGLVAVSSARGETPEERLRRYEELYSFLREHGEIGETSFEEWAALAELEGIRQAACNWNANSPDWSKDNECYDQALALRRHLANNFKPIFWDPQIVGGSKWNFGLMKKGIRNHNVLGLYPIRGNPLDPMYFDPYKGPLQGSGTPGANKCGPLERFKNEYPHPVHED